VRPVPLVVVQVPIRAIEQQLVVAPGRVGAAIGGRAVAVVIVGVRLVVGAAVGAG
jgi:hypothetical protein